MSTEEPIANNAGQSAGSDIANGSDQFEAEFQRGIALREANCLEESRQVLQTFVEGRTRLQGRKGFDTQCAISQLGRTLRTMENHTKAVELHWEVLTTRLELYGPSDPRTQRSAGILIESLDKSSPGALEMNRARVSIAMHSGQLAQHDPGIIKKLHRDQPKDNGMVVPYRPGH